MVGVVPFRPAGQGKRSYRTVWQETKNRSALSRSGSLLVQKYHVGGLLTLFHALLEVSQYAEVTQGRASDNVLNLSGLLVLLLTAADFNQS